MPFSKDFLILSVKPIFRWNLMPPKPMPFMSKMLSTLNLFCLTQCHQNGWLCKNSCSKTMYCIYHRIYHAALVQNRIDCLAVCSVLTPLLADLGKYRLSAVVSLLCYGDPNWPSSRRSRVRSIDCRRAQCGRRRLRADGWRNHVSTSCSVLYIHTEQPVPNHRWEHPASHEGSWTKAPSDNAWSSWLNPKWMVK